MRMADGAARREWFCEMVERNKLGLFRLAKSILRNDEDAGDAVAEAVCSAYANLASLRDSDKFKPWIMRILANES